MVRQKQVLTALFLVGLVGCSGSEPGSVAVRSASAKGVVPMDRTKDAAGAAIRIGETTVGLVGRCRIGVANIFVDKFTDEGGQQKEGPGVSLSIIGPPPCQGKTVRVHEGQRVQVGEGFYLVTRVEKPPTGRGAVELKPV